jgi:DnaJ-class molecular chaperone
MVTCYDCKGKGYQEFLGHLTDCKPCDNTGQLVVCSSYVLPMNTLVVFRNQKCHNCGVKESDHIVSEVTA